MSKSSVKDRMVIFIHFLKLVENMAKNTVVKPGKRQLRVRSSVEKMVELKYGVKLLQRSKLLGRRPVKLEVIMLGMMLKEENKMGGRT